MQQFLIKNEEKKNGPKPSINKKNKLYFENKSISSKINKRLKKKNHHSTNQILMIRNFV